MLALRLPPEIERRLEGLAQKTGRTIIALAVAFNDHIEFPLRGQPFAVTGGFMVDNATDELKILRLEYSVFRC